MLLAQHVPQGAYIDVDEVKVRKSKVRVLLVFSAFCVQILPLHLFEAEYVARSMTSSLQ